MDEFTSDASNDMYIESISVEDLPLVDLTFTGMRVCGTGLLMVIGCLMILRIFKNA